MEQEFNQATQKLKTLQHAINEACARNPQAQIRDEATALSNMTAVFVTPRHNQFVVGVYCGDGSENFEIDAGISRDHGEKIARALVAQNADLQVLSHKAPQPFIAVNPARIKSVDDFGSHLIFEIEGAAKCFSVQHQNAHRANLDSFLFGNKLMNMRGTAPKAESKTGQSFPLPRPDKHF